MRIFRKSFVGGFTLIELLVVISIIAILTAVATVSYTNVQQKSRDGKRKSDLAAIQQALAVYYQDTGHYPPWDGAGNEQIGWCTIINTSNVTWKADVYDKLVPTFIKQMPKDPVNLGGTGDYFYVKTAKGHYQLWAALENSNDPDRITGSACSGLGTNNSPSLNYFVTEK